MKRLRVKTCYWERYSLLTGGQFPNLFEAVIGLIQLHAMRVYLNLWHHSKMTSGYREKNPGFCLFFLFSSPEATRGPSIFVHPPGGGLSVRRIQTCMFLCPLSSKACISFTRPVWKATHTGSEITCGFILVSHYFSLCINNP